MLFFLLPLFGAIKSESYPQKLSDEEERMYLLRYAQTKDETARAKLIEHNLRLVAHIAKKYENTQEDKDDILSIGILGLMKAVDSYQITANNKLATYAARCIENEILMHLRSTKNKRNLIYLQSPVAMDKDGNEVELLDLIEDKSIDIMASYEKKAMHQDLNEALKSLNSREYEIIARRYGIARDSQTQKEIAKDMNISRSYVSRIEKRALLKLYFLLKK
ncbi:MAG: RNA polymerase sporulation sigma factor SigK [Anaeroplasmataceae bacterium]|nr:RNA polymerase sporulation sigma factor SigK [Anaeroplasmataceae bacterium]MDE6407073.1 RNA polymerase sporulation sigma factor SigK [Anaeroplasmataceae bacterium]MDE6414043.1 RNA polymerase sporulation sigma factor SigK [Anaeroplasmataceae bacterium]MDE7384277.1 RNA polymerase sporulation sigma factor SigK [Anaeroplasmataceae bacterium]